MYSYIYHIHFSLSGKMAEMLLVIKANLDTVYLAPSTEIDEDDITEDSNENEDELQIIDY